MLMFTRSLKVIICMTAIWLISAVIYNLVAEEDPYKHYTGIGDSISISPDDQEIIFSYYVDGKQSIYKADGDGKHVKKLIRSKDKQLEHPVFADDGKHILYLAKTENGVNQLYVANQKGKEIKKASPSDMHVDSAAFTPDGKRIYYVGMDAKTFSKMRNLGAEDANSPSPDFDIYAVSLDGKQNEKLTDDHGYLMTDLNVSPDGKLIYYSSYEGAGQEVHALDIEKRKETVLTANDFSGEQVGDSSIYSPAISFDGTKMAITAVARESRDSSLYHYDLYLLDLKKRQMTRLTDLQSAVTSPVFFHHENKIAYLHQKNWSSEPAEYEIETVDLNNKYVSSVKLDTPAAPAGSWFGKVVDLFSNINTIAVLYSLLFICLTLLYRNHRRRRYAPALASFGLAILLFIASFAVAALFGNPWLGIGLGMLSAGMFICSIFPLLTAVVVHLMTKRYTDLPGGNG